MVIFTYMIMLFYHIKCERLNDMIGDKFMVIKEYI